MIKTDEMNTIIRYENTNNLVKDVCTIIDEAKQFAYQTVDTTLVLRNWYIGKRIDEEVLEGKDRAKYGAEVVDKLSKELTGIYGKGYSKRILYQCLKVYRMFPGIVNEARSQLLSNEKMNEARSQTGIPSWTHYRILTQVEDTTARKWYEKEAYKQVWSTTTLQRNVSSQYYYRILKSQDKQAVEDEMKKLTSSYQNKLEFIKSPVIAEFLGMQQDTSYLESDLEQSIIDNLQKFLMELGKGYAFVARQQHIHTEKEDYTSRCWTDGYVYPYV